MKMTIHTGPALTVTLQLPSQISARCGPINIIQPFPMTLAIRLMGFTPRFNYDRLRLINFNVLLVRLF